MSTPQGLSLDAIQCRSLAKSSESRFGFGLLPKTLASQVNIGSRRLQKRWRTHRLCKGTNTVRSVFEGTPGREQRQKTVGCRAGLFALGNRTIDLRTAVAQV